MTLSNKTYDILKWVALYLLPALGTLYFTLSGLWGLPYGEQVVGTITAVDTFIAVIIGISTYNYKGDGVLEIDRNNPDSGIYHINIGTPLDELPDKKEVVLKVDPNASIEMVEGDELTA